MTYAFWLHLALQCTVFVVCPYVLLLAIWAYGHTKRWERYAQQRRLDAVRDEAAKVAASEGKMSDFMIRYLVRKALRDSHDPDDR